MIDIPAYKSIQLNDLNEKNNFQFKIVNDTCIMEQLIVERNAHYLNQADGIPFIVKPLAILIIQNSFTRFSKEMLEGSANLST